jgi:hypothetical protein
MLISNLHFWSHVSRVVPPIFWRNDLEFASSSKLGNCERTSFWWSDKNLFRISEIIIILATIQFIFSGGPLCLFGKLYSCNGTQIRWEGCRIAVMRFGCSSSPTSKTRVINFILIAFMMIALMDLKVSAYMMQKRCYWTQLTQFHVQLLWCLHFDDLCIYVHLFNLKEVMEDLWWYNSFSFL